MNYIKRLQKEKAQAEAEAMAMRSAINELRSYLSSSKFRDDTTVQVGDVIERLRQSEDFWLREYEEAIG